jgi:8-oxo-dGTP diphosphatase
MKQYACGFLFSVDGSRVVLIRKNRPAWQAGKLNGVGGKLELGETPSQAMRREFREEAGLDVESWEQVLTITGEPTAFDPSGWQGHFFRAFGDVDTVRTLMDEPLEVHPTLPVPAGTIPNLMWMIPLMLDEDVRLRRYRVSLEGIIVGK